MSKFMYQNPILLDCDGVVCDFIGKILDYINNKYNKEFTHEIMTDDFRIVFKEYWNPEFEEYIQSPGFCSDLKTLPGAEEAVYKLLQSKYPVIFVTSPYKDSPTWAHDRMKWLEKHFDITRENIIFAKNKQNIHGRALIDDHVENIELWTQFNQDLITPGRWMFPVLFKQPWNKKEQLSLNIQWKTGYTNDWNKILDWLLNSV